MVGISSVGMKSQNDTNGTQRLKKAIASMHDESCSLWLPTHVQSYDSIPDALTFLRDHVSPSIPCVLRGACRHWPATTEWPRDDFANLRRKVGNKQVNVTITPDGFADSIVQLSSDRQTNETNEQRRVFVEPMIQQHTISQVLNACVRKQSLGNGIPYYSAQNSNLSTDVPQLLDDIHELPFVVDVFNFNHDKNGQASNADAVNIWIGDERSVTSMHADPFENIYAVVKGCKSFVLRPPSDAAILPKPKLKRAIWSREAEGEKHEQEMDRKDNLHTERSFPGWYLQKVDGKTSWIDEQGIPETLQHSVQVDVFEGDIIYLPALWYHRVTQKDVTIAVNWWYDMAMGSNWVYRELCANIGRICYDNGDVAPDDDSSGSEVIPTVKYSEAREAHS